MPHLHYSENGVITSCNPNIKHMENKLVSTVNVIIHIGIARPPSVMAVRDKSDCYCIVYSVIHI